MMFLNMRLVGLLLLCFPSMGGDVSLVYGGRVDYINRVGGTSNGVTSPLYDASMAQNIMVILSITMGVLALFCLAVLNHRNMKAVQQFKKSIDLKSTLQLKLEKQVMELQSRVDEIKWQNKQLEHKCEQSEKKTRELCEKCEHHKAENSQLKFEINILEESIRTDADRKARESKEQTAIITIERSPKSRRVTFAPYMVIEDVCYFDEYGLFKDDKPASQTRLCV